MSFFRLPEYVAETRRQCGLMLLCLTGAAGVAAAASALGLPVYSTLLAAALLLLRVLDHLPGRAQGKATGFASSREALETRANMAVPDAIRLVEHLHYTRELAAKVRDTLLAQQADHAIDRLHTAKERVGVPPNPAARDGTRLVQLCRPTQVNAVATTSLWCRLRCLHRPVIWCRPRCLLVCLRRFLSLRPMPWEKRSARRISSAR